MGPIDMKAFDAGMAARAQERAALASSAAPAKRGAEARRADPPPCARAAVEGLAAAVDALIARPAGTRPGHARPHVSSETSLLETGLAAAIDALIVAPSSGARQSAPEMAAPAASRTAAESGLAAAVDLLIGAGAAGVGADALAAAVDDLIEGRSR
jgi:hypothetical protein